MLNTLAATHSVGEEEWLGLGLGGERECVPAAGVQDYGRRAGKDLIRGKWGECADRERGEREGDGRPKPFF
jgi:hypothetical protein